MCVCVFVCFKCIQVVCADSTVCVCFMCMHTCVKMFKCIYVSHVYICVLMCFECVVCVLERVLCSCLREVVLL